MHTAVQKRVLDLKQISQATIGDAHAETVIQIMVFFTGYVPAGLFFASVFVTEMSTKETLITKLIEDSKTRHNVPCITEDQVSARTFVFHLMLRFE